MKAFWLLALLIAVFYGNAPLSYFTGIDRTLLFYIGQGIIGSAFFGFWTLAARNRYWRTACAFGFVQEALVVVCGLAYIVKPVLPGPWENLADSQTGLPVSWVGLVCSLALMLYVYRAEERKQKAMP